MWPFRATIFLLALVYFSPVFLVAKDHKTGVLQGVVEDASGELVPGAEVKLDHKSTGQKFETTSNETGKFEFRNLPGGDYILGVKAQGFKETQMLFAVGTALVHPIRLHLELAEIREEITVTDSLPFAASAEENIDVIELDQEWIQNLPTKDGDPLAAVYLFLDPSTFGTKGPKIIVDGVETDGLEIPTSSIKSVRINKSPYSAEFERPGMGRIDVTSQDSSSRFRGDFSLRVRNSAVDARNAFATLRPPVQRVVPELRLTGPLGQKVAFSLAGQYVSGNESTVINAVTPAGGLVQNIRIPERNTYLFGRLDFRLSPTQTLTIGYNFKNKFRQNERVGEFDLPERGTNLFRHKNEVKILERAILSASFSNELRFVYRQDTLNRWSLVDRPAIIVLDAFKGGGAQVSQHKTETSADLQDIVGLIKGRQAFRFGGGVRPRFFQARIASNFGGTFIFSNLAAFTAGRPLSFTINQGDDPMVSYPQHEFYAFFQDEIRLRPNFSLSLGLRHELQSNSEDHNNFAPRLAFAYSPRGRKTVLRGGVGIFYERQPEVMELDSLLYNGVRVRRLVLSNPAFPVPFDPGANLRLAPSVVRIAPEMRNPYLFHGSFAVERKLGREQNHLSVKYSTTRAVKLYQMRNINAPFPGSRIRPDPNFFNVDQFESSGRSSGHSLSVMFKAQLWRRMDLLSQYTISRTMDDTGKLFSLPANNYDLRGEWGLSDFDRRHRFNFIGIYRLPSNVRLSGIVDLRSSIPFNITTGFDDNHDSVPNDRPPGVGRNTGRGPGYATIDLSLSKRFRLEKDHSRSQFELGLDAFNVFNHVNFKNFIGTLSSPFFARATAAYSARQLQLSLRFQF